MPKSADGNGNTSRDWEEPTHISASFNSEVVVTVLLPISWRYKFFAVRIFMPLGLRDEFEVRTDAVSRGGFDFAVVLKELVLEIVELLSSRMGQAV